MNEQDICGSYFTIRKHFMRSLLFFFLLHFFLLSSSTFNLVHSQIRFVICYYVFVCGVHLYIYELLLLLRTKPTAEFMIFISDIKCVRQNSPFLVAFLSVNCVRVLCVCACVRFFRKVIIFSAFLLWFSSLAFTFPLQSLWRTAKNLTEMAIEIKYEKRFSFISFGDDKHKNKRRQFK